MGNEFKAAFEIKKNYNLKCITTKSIKFIYHKERRANTPQK